MASGSGLALCAAMGIAAADEAAPEWLHLLPAGEIRTRDDRGPYRVPDAQALITASMARGKLVLDECHATDLAAPKGLPAPARGWIVDLQARADGVWGRVEWSSAAQQSQPWREYRGVSPVIVHDKDGAVHAILRASLTNQPNFTGLVTLHQSENDVALRMELAGLLGLPATADDTAIVNKVKLLVGGQGRTVAAHAAQARARELSMHAAAYQSSFAKNGLKIDFATAVRAVQDGVTSPFAG